MRILIHSPAPWCKTGYALQAGQLALGLASLGHDTAISAHYGLQGSPIAWHDIPVYPGGDMNWGEDSIGHHAKHFRADLVVTIGDHWIMDPNPFEILGRHVKLASWMPIDCDPLGYGDEKWLSTTLAKPIAMSRHGEAMLKAAGFDPLYVPHMVDCLTFRPGAAPADDGAFVVGINAANNDHSRKGYPEQFQALAKLIAKHDDVLVLVHSRAQNLHARGLDLYDLASACGLGEHVRFVEQDSYRFGLIGDDALADWYARLDLLSNASWGEGFGLPVVEAQACGTPVVVTKASAMPELCGAGWMAGGERFWNPVHQAWWVKPSVSSILRCYEQAYRDAPRLRERARDFAYEYDVKVVLPLWESALESLCR